MTTIAYRNGVLAADTRMCLGDNLLGTTVKIARNANGDLAGAAGDATYNFAFLKWFTGLESTPPPEAKQTDNNIDRGVIFRKNGVIEVYEPRGQFQVVAPYYAFGSGRPEALGAMYAGADAETAVRAASAHDAFTGGDVTILRHER